MNPKKILVVLVIISVLAVGGYSIFFNDTTQEPVDNDTEDSSIFPSNVTASNSSLASISYRSDNLGIVSGDNQVDSVYVAYETTNESTGETSIRFERISDSGFATFNIPDGEVYGIAVGVGDTIYRVSEVRARQ